MFYLVLKLFILCHFSSNLCDQGILIIFIYNVKESKKTQTNNKKIIEEYGLKIWNIITLEINIDWNFIIVGNWLTSHVVFNKRVNWYLSILLLC